MKTKSILNLLIVLVFIIFSTEGKSQIQIVSGMEGGTYNQLTHDIQNIIELPIDIFTSEGALDNYQQLMEENGINITFLQYDVLLAEELINPRVKDRIRVLLPLFLDEEIHLIAKKDDKINSLSDLEMKKVGVGAITQGTKVTAQTIKNRTGINWEDVEISSNESIEALMNGDIDAFFYVGGAPISFLQTISDIGLDKIKLVSIKHKKLNDIYTKAKITSGTYTWAKYDVFTYAVPTLMVINISKISDDFKQDVERLYFGIKSNVNKLQTEGHPKWKDVYYENTTINWPYYYIPEKKKTESGK